MRDYFNVRLSWDEIQNLSTLALANAGDAVYELMVRTRLCANGVSTAKNLHKHTVEAVSAPAQAKAAQKIMKLMTEREHEVFMRGRNTRVNMIPRGSTSEDYHLATGLEALFGYLYLTGGYDRLNILFDGIMNNDTKQ
jgi:ribonuclease-3 family protein